MPIPDSLKGISGREKGEALSRAARYALHHSAELSGGKTREFQKNKYGVPVPANGVYWSLSHAADYVAAVISHQPVGIDIEKIVGFSNFLKAEGVGLEGLEECRVLAFVGKDRMTLGFKSSLWTVRFRHFPDDHTVALTCPGLPIIWSMLSF